MADRSGTRFVLNVDESLRKMYLRYLSQWTMDYLECRQAMKRDFYRVDDKPIAMADDQGDWSYISMGEKEE